MLSTRMVVFAVALVVIALAGCEESRVTFVPDTTPPLAPQITGGITKDGCRAVLSWTPNTEPDLAGYNVYQMGPVRRLNLSIIHDPMFVTRLDGDAVFVFRVTAVDRSGNESAPSATVRVRIGPQGRTVEPIGGEGGQR